MRKNIFSLILHPLFLSLIVTVVIVLLFFPNPSKYVVEQIDQSLFSKTVLIFYDDLDCNGYADRIQCTDYAQKNGLASMFIQFDPDLFIQEWYFPGGFSFANKLFVRTGDFNGDGQKELYIFTISHDSVFLHVVSNLFNEAPLHMSRFVTVVSTVGGQPDVTILNIELEDMDFDGFKDLIFAINSGFPVNPRNVYLFDIKKDSLAISPPNGYNLNQLIARDINGDKTKEIIVTGYATQNIQDTTQYEIHDRCCWLIVLDHKLKYLFPPVRFSNYGYSSLANTCLPNNRGFFDIYSFYIPPQASRKEAYLFKFGNHGEIQKSRPVPGIIYNKGGGIFLLLSRGDPQLILSNYSGGILSFDTAFRETNLHLNPEVVFLPGDTLDVDGDGEKEIISINTIKREGIIFRSDLTKPAYFQLPNQDYIEAFFSLKTEPTRDPILVLYSQGNEFHYLYRKNLLYYLRWLIYAGIFLAIYLFTLLIRKTQRIQIEKKIKTEKKITELQLKIVKNQMDPHFTMNAINSVIAAIRQDKKETASQSLLHFSKMYRSLVLSGDKIKRSLAEEIDFSRNYLELEKFRFKDRFDYQMELDAAVNLNLEVPKMIIQSPVENAIKHGLLNKESGGMLIIRAFEKDHQVILEVEDNGIGRGEAQKEGSTGTGKGLKIMEEFLELYHKITGVRIQWQVTDLYAESGSASGTKVVITIPAEQR